LRFSLERNKHSSLRYKETASFTEGELCNMFFVKAEILIEPLMLKAIQSDPKQISIDNQ